MLTDDEPNKVSERIARYNCQLNKKAIVEEPKQRKVEKGRKAKRKGKKQEAVAPTRRILVIAPPKGIRTAGQIAHEAFLWERLATTPISSYIQHPQKTPATAIEIETLTYTTFYFKIPDRDLVYHLEIDLRKDSLERVRTVVSAFEERLVETLVSPLQPTVLFRYSNPIGSPEGNSEGPLSPLDSSGGGASTSHPMANPQRNSYPLPFTKHSYAKFKGRGDDDDDDVDSYIKLFESMSTSNKEDNDKDMMRIFPSLLRKRARSATDDIEEVIASAEASETSMLNGRRKNRGFDHCERKS
ncbi:hypothetical protein AXG93_2838s1000 [Marchantia polymorpha subsp. ruderalis]|uniref:Uncharacterized protein n=1 Tax=Marchantia polymorpha subsp. ruderalis TaxID=1480154 RepID=A0A176VMN4_MARPO|nr:hypothetical protein AXG93_2838s1000 [Marchantia polymorpha subsp. ruderalis]